MPGVTRSQIERAKQVDILDYLLAHEPGNLKKTGNEYRLRDHDSLTISNGYWHWHSRGFGGKTATALNYLIKVRDMSFVDAVRHLANDAVISYAQQPRKPPPPPKKLPFTLPPRNKDNERVIAYLQSRGIDRALIDACIAAGVLYESATYHNCVFTGKNEQGKTRFGCMRGTTGDFKRDLDGSDKRYGFLLAPETPAGQGHVAVFEAPVDALSHLTMYRQGHLVWDGWRLTLSGSSLLALIHFLEQHPEVDNCHICTDNDKTGEQLTGKILALPDGDARQYFPQDYTQQQMEAVIIALLDGWKADQSGMKMAV